jgi:23S rRNA (guanosine2251-2'-O)-methyltransferase
MHRKIPNDELIRLTPDEFRKAVKIPLTVVLDDVRSMHNIGSVFRSADAFLVEKIILCGISAVPPHKDIHKTALGATETVAWEYYENIWLAIEKLRTENYRIVGIEQTEKSIMLNDFMPQSGERYACIFGHEVRGINQEVVNGCDFIIEIPQFGTKHSLNISVCAGVVIWDFYRKIRNSD